MFDFLLKKSYVSLKNLKQIKNNTNLLKMKAVLNFKD